MRLAALSKFLSFLTISFHFGSAGCCCCSPLLYIHTWLVVVDPSVFFSFLCSTTQPPSFNFHPNPTNQMYVRLTAMWCPVFQALSLASLRNETGEKFAVVVNDFSFFFSLIDFLELLWKQRKIYFHPHQNISFLFIFLEAFTNSILPKTTITA